MCFEDHIAFLDYAYNRRSHGIRPARAAQDLGVSRRTILRWIKAGDRLGWGIRWAEEPDSDDRRSHIYRLVGIPRFLRADEVARLRDRISAQALELRQLREQLSAVRHLIQQISGVTG